MRNSSEAVSLHNVNINSISESSGVFIGYNQAHHWHSTKKTNQGFGEVNSASTNKVINIVQDNDVIDFISSEKNMIKKPMEKPDNILIKFNGVNVNAVTTNSSVNVGENEQNIWHNSEKVNYGNGKFLGINQVSDMINKIDDSDTIDNINLQKSKQIKQASS